MARDGTTLTAVADPVWARAGSASSPPWFQDAVFYEIPVKSFFDSNADGNADACTNADVYADTNTDAESGSATRTSGSRTKGWIPELRSTGNSDQRHLQQSGTIGEDCRVSRARRR